LPADEVTEIVDFHDIVGIEGVNIINPALLASLALAVSGLPPWARTRAGKSPRAWVLPASCGDAGRRPSSGVGHFRASQTLSIA
jgi:hypothetical protein